MTLHEFEQLARGAAEKHKMSFGDDLQIRVEFSKWNDKQVVCKVTFYTAEDSFMGEASTPEIAVSIATEKYLRYINHPNIQIEFTND